MRFYDKHGELHRFYLGSLIIPTINKIKKSSVATKARQTVNSVKNEFVKTYDPDISFTVPRSDEEDVIDIEPDDVDGI